MYCVCWVLCTQLCITLIKTAGLNGELANALLLLFTGEFFVLFAGFIHAVARVRVCVCACVNTHCPHASAPEWAGYGDHLQAL